MSNPKYGIHYMNDLVNLEDSDAEDDTFDMLGLAAD